MDTAYGRRWIRRIGNCEYAFSCEDLAVILHISFPGYGVLARCDHKLLESSHLVPLSNCHNSSLVVALGRELFQNNMLMCCEPDMVYGLHPIRRISDELALVVEIDFTWSLGFEDRISLMMFEFSSCLFADSAMNLVNDSSNVCLRSGYEEFSLLPSSFSRNGTFRVKDLSDGNIESIIE
nr:hypothetical protein [Tanacetum cinerariifolium]